MANLGNLFNQIDLSSRSSIMVITAGMTLAQYMDTITTIAGVNRHGLQIEANSFVHYAITNYGFMGFISQKIFAMMVVMGLTAALFELGFKRSVVILLGCFTFLIGAIATHNLYILYVLQ
ncbi:MAG: hypothetical protein SVJ22_08445 [Halobacteriota archaeon]|nr:hypothetical protein [Halobacteriota archaeon]